MIVAQLRRVLSGLPGVAWRVGAFLMAIAAAVVIATGWARWEGRASHQVTDDAYLQADVMPVSSKVAGYVREVPVQDYERVRSGQLLAKLEDDDYRAGVAQSAANVAAAQAQVQVLAAQGDLQSANVGAARAVVAATSAAFDQAGRDVARQHSLLDSGSGSVEGTEHAETRRAELQAQLDQNRAQAQAAARQLEVLTAQLAQARAALAAQEASLKLATINLDYTRIVAPQDGVIAQRQVRPGQYLGVGGQVTILTPLPKVWVIANYRETQLTHVDVGQPATVTVDTFPGHTLKGHVLALAPASGSQFTLLPPDNATGNFTKVVQRIPVKIAIDDADGLADRLRPGMSVVATIETKTAKQGKLARDGEPK
jgi:membrane fusion protein (multidrug efflux system)